MTEPQDPPPAEASTPDIGPSTRKAQRLRGTLCHPRPQEDPHPIAGDARKPPLSVAEIQCDQMRHDQPGQKIELLHEAGSKLSAL